MRKTVQITRTACKAFHDSLVILKLYPTQRYADDYDFYDLLPEFQNLKIVKNIEFRFIRTAADLLLTTSTQSTLGWVHGTGIPYMYLDFTWSPGRISGLRMHIHGIEGLSAAILPSVGQVCSSHCESIASVLIQ
jgi:hypothetical protein